MYISAANKENINLPKCMKETWITELPKALIFSLNRVTYDVKSASLVKNCKRFDFDKTIYADKYLIESINRD